MTGTHIAVHPEVVLAVAYALFLLVAALILEGAARGTHGRAKMYRHRGFRFHRHLDVWECPAGEHLSRRETDQVRRLVRYRARAEKCNSCALKTACTDSGDGREIVHSAEDWLDTEVGRFHRGISLALLGLAALILTVFWVRHHSVLDSLVLAAALAAVIVTIATFARSFWKTSFSPDSFQKDATKKAAFWKQATSADQAGPLSASPWSDDAKKPGRDRPRR